jgi:hypothetical protein
VEVKASLPDSVWAAISPEVYSLFWSLSLQDIYAPREQYLAQIESLRNDIASNDALLRAVRLLGFSVWRGVLCRRGSDVLLVVVTGR